MADFNKTSFKGKINNFIESPEDMMKQFKNNTQIINVKENNSYIS